jgi:cell division control protein 24
VWELKINGLIGPSGQGSQLNDGSGGFDVNEQPQTLVATLSRGSGPPPEIRDLDVGSPTPAGNTLPSDCQPRIQTEPNDASPALTVVKVNVHINEAMFVLQVPQTIDYEGLVEKIMCKLRLLGPPLEEPVRLKYRDQEGDMVAVNSSEDVQMALEECQPGGQLMMYIR